jgi:hypothetical protein
LRVHVISGLGFGFLLTITSAWGCGDSGGDSKGQSTRLGSPGESCQRSSECQAPLGCFAGACATAPAQLAKTGKVCKVVDCVVADDCCTIKQTASQCQSWKSGCLTQPSQCDLYSSSCTCENWTCSAGSCEPKDRCSPASDACTLLHLVCNGTKCVQCLSGMDCPPDAKCTNQKCVRACKSNRDCDYLFECQSGTCIKAGCKTNRECIALEDNERAVCHGGQCSVPCETSEECRSSDFPLKLMACIDKTCIDVGCDSDEECRIRVNEYADAGGAKNALCVPSKP